MSHAILSPSGASRWLACPPSARLEQEFPDSTSDFAREGTLAHEICELKVSHKFLGKNVGAAMSRCKKNELYQKEMEGYTDQYVDFVSKFFMAFNSEPFIAVEQRLDISKYVPQCFGTGDCILIGGQILHIVDFKYGKGVPVFPEGNPQMMMYALGAYEKYKLLYDIKRINMSIVQPRLGSFETAGMDIEALLAWANDELRPKAQLAWDGKGDMCAGAHCRFCRAKAQCRTRAETNMALDGAARDPKLLTPEEVGEYLTKSQDLVSWANDLKEYALSSCLAGKEIPGWKAVEGRSTRAWTNEDEAFEYAHKELRIPNTKLYEKRPLSVAKLEKVIGKDKFEGMAAYITKPAGKPALAEENDKRPAITLKTTAADAFGNKEE